MNHTSHSYTSVGTRMRLFRDFTYLPTPKNEFLRVRHRFLKKQALQVYFTHEISKGTWLEFNSKRGGR